MTPAAPPLRAPPCSGRAILESGDRRSPLAGTAAFADYETQSQIMIVCCCFGTTDREIRAAFGQGGSGACPAGQGCGSCLDNVERIAAEAQQRAAGPSEGSSAAPAPRPARRA